MYQVWNMICFLFVLLVDIHVLLILSFLWSLILSSLMYVLKCVNLKKLLHMYMNINYFTEALSPSSCNESSFIWLYPTLIGFIAVFAIGATVCSCLIHKNLQLRRQVNQKLKMDDSRSSTEIDASSEEETDLLKKSHEGIYLYNTTNRFVLDMASNFVLDNRH